METNQVKYKVSLSQTSSILFELTFREINGTEISSKTIKLNETHKGSKIGEICHQLILFNHTSWEVERNKSSSLYDFDQPDLMLESQLYKAKLNH